MTHDAEKKWMLGLTERSGAVALVRGLLGCTCPEEIFDHYHIRQRLMEGHPVTELIMGDRLLVWIIQSHRIADPEQILGRLLRGGLTERDDRGLNRFRLVVVGPVASWEREFGGLAHAMDPKVHLHVVPEIPVP